MRKGLLLLALLTGAFFPVVHLLNSVRHPPGMAFVGGGLFQGDGRRAYLAEFYIDRYEVTNEEFRRFVTATGYKPQGQWQSYFEAGKERWPVCSVSWNDAHAYARYQGKRLPSVLEWRKACGGPSGRLYPWGDRWESGAANVNTTGAAAVGSFPRDCSPYGVYDMAGNLFEWTANRVPANPSWRTVCGGCWIYPLEAASADHVTAYDGSQFSHVIGFRCAWP